MNNRLGPPANTFDDSYDILVKIAILNQQLLQVQEKLQNVEQATLPPVKNIESTDLTKLYPNRDEVLHIAKEAEKKRKATKAAFESSKKLKNSDVNSASASTSNTTVSSQGIFSNTTSSSALMIPQLNTEKSPPQNFIDTIDTSVFIRPGKRINFFLQVGDGLYDMKASDSGDDDNDCDYSDSSEENSTPEVAKIKI